MMNCKRHTVTIEEKSVVPSNKNSRFFYCLDLVRYIWLNEILRYLHLVGLIVKSTIVLSKSNYFY